MRIRGDPDSDRSTRQREASRGRVETGCDAHETVARAMGHACRVDEAKIKVSSVECRLKG